MEHRGNSFKDDPLGFNSVDREIRINKLKQQLEEISRRLDRRFEVLCDPTSWLSECRRALSVAIGWSYELFFLDDQWDL